MKNKIVSTTYAPLRPPYQVIKYNQDVAMQIGTLIVTVQKDESEYQIETHSHPVVAYEYKDRDEIANTPLFDHQLLEGAVWNNVEVREVTTVCLAGAKLTWNDFLKVLDYEALMTMYRKTPDVGIYWRLLKLGVKVLPPAPEERDGVIMLRMMPQPEEVGISLQAESGSPLFLNVSVAEDDFKTGKENVFYIPEEERWDSKEWKDDDSIWYGLNQQLSAYRSVLRDLLIDQDVNHFTVEYWTDEPRFFKIVERLNKTDQFVNLAYLS